MNAARYRLSFTTGGLFLQEAPVVAKRYLVLGDWNTTRDQVRSENLLQVRTSTAAIRISKELISRLELLSTDELQYLTAAKGTFNALIYLHRYRPDTVSAWCWVICATSVINSMQT